MTYRLPSDETSQELLGLFESLRQGVVGVLEVGARRSSASSDMQRAQAQLVRQGVLGVTSDRMLSGSVQLVSPARHDRLDATCVLTGHGHICVDLAQL